MDQDGMRSVYKEIPVVANRFQMVFHISSFWVSPINRAVTVYEALLHQQVKMSSIKNTP
jgi:hypothetical protein